MDLWNLCQKWKRLWRNPDKKKKKKKKKKKSICQHNNTNNEKKKKKKKKKYSNLPSHHNRFPSNFNRNIRISNIKKTQKNNNNFGCCCVFLVLFVKLSLGFDGGGVKIEESSIRHSIRKVYIYTVHLFVFREHFGWIFGKKKIKILEW